MLLLTLDERDNPLTNAIAPMVHVMAEAVSDVQRSVFSSASLAAVFLSIQLTYLDFDLTAYHPRT